MKQNSGVLVIPRQPMVAVSPSAAYLSPAMGVPTPSPFSFSVASTRWSSSRPQIHIFGHFLRAMVMVFSFGSSLAVAATMSNKSFKHPEFVYSFVVTISVFIYSAYQLFKGVCDIAHRGILISDKTSDYISFALDKLAGYLLVSCSSVMMVAILQLSGAMDDPKLKDSEYAKLRKAAIISFCMSIAALLGTTVCAILSGYKLSKRIMW